MESWEAANYSLRPDGPANARSRVIRLIHLTDPHLTSLDGLRLRQLRGKRWSGYLSWRRRRRFVHRLEVLERLVAAVHAENPVQILVTGDLVHVGLPGEIEAAASWLEALGPPGRVMLVPGNHDVYARDSWPAVARAWLPYLSEPYAANEVFPLRRRIDTPEGPVSLIGLSSAVPSALFMAHGRLGAGQCARFDGALAEAEGFRCVLVHHPPLPAMTSWRKGLKDAADLERVLARHGAELVLHGHVHRNVSRAGPAGARIFGTASASSGSEDAAAAYRSFDLTRRDGGWQVQMRLMCLEAGGGCRVVGSESWTAVLKPAASAPGAAQ